MPIIEGEFPANPGAGHQLGGRCGNVAARAASLARAFSAGPHRRAGAAVGGGYLCPRELRERSDPVHIAPRMERSGGQVANCAETCGARDFDTAILLPNAFEAAALVWLAGIPRRIGYARDGRGFLLTTRGHGSGERRDSASRTLLLPRTAAAGRESSMRDARRPSRSGSAARRRLARRDWRGFAAIGLERVTGVSPGRRVRHGEAMAARAVRRSGRAARRTRGAIRLERRARLVREASPADLRRRGHSRS